MPSSGVQTCALDRKSTRLNSSHRCISYAVFCLKKLPEGLFSVVEFQHVKPGKGGAFVRTKLTIQHCGAVIERTYRADEIFNEAITAKIDMLFLYRARSI